MGKSIHICMLKKIQMDRGWSGYEYLGLLAAGGSEEGESVCLFAMAVVSFNSSLVESEADVDSYTARLSISGHGFSPVIDEGMIN